jgi:hypothetical protein
MSQEMSITATIMVIITPTVPHTISIMVPIQHLLTNQMIMLVLNNNYYLLHCTHSIWAVKLHLLDIFLFYTVTHLNIAFLVPGSSRADGKKTL